MGERRSSAFCLSKRVEEGTTAEVRFGVEAGNPESQLENVWDLQVEMLGRDGLWELRGGLNLGDDWGLKGKLRILSKCIAFKAVGMGVP